MRLEKSKNKKYFKEVESWEQVLAKRNSATCKLIRDYEKSSGQKYYETKEEKPEEKSEIISKSKLRKMRKQKAKKNKVDLVPNMDP